MGRRKKAAPCLSPAPPNTPTKQCPPWRQPVVLSRPTRSRGARCAEVAGGTAADCTAVCCCCPCGLLGLLVLAVVRVPARFCRRAFLRCKKKKEITAASRKRKCGEGATAGDAGATHMGLLGPRVVSARKDDDKALVGGGDDFGVAGWQDKKSPAAEVSEMEMEMLACFYGGGFWRTASQRET
ncbi:hypothetical protein Taro_024840 [Colocasia esculenta]|uniref:Uncharacterized protein n=1 Tax=Colocasia esculenta TaxID=4460 RepID=A0A843VCF8_COLES|nr:hypothetical protein [Colocasia esculenta]